MTRRDLLLAKCLRYFVAHGVANVSLRPIAASVGTSARMLVHHFGSKEQLIAAVMGRVRERLQSSFARLRPRLNPDSSADLIVEFWKLLTRKSELPYVRLLFEVQVLAIQNPGRYMRYLSDTSLTWLDTLQLALPKGKNPPGIGTLLIAAVDGLLLEYMATGDRRRTSDALDLFVALLNGQCRGRPDRVRVQPKRRAA